MSFAEPRYAVNQPPRTNITNGIDRILSFPRVSVYAVNAQSIPNNQGTAIAWDSEEYDTEGMWSTTDPTGIYARTAGLWLFHTTVGFASNTAGYRQVSLWVNGAANFYANTIFYNTAAGVGSQASISWPLVLNAGDFVRVVVAQNSGAALGTTPATGTNRANGFHACLISLP